MAVINIIGNNIQEIYTINYENIKEYMWLYSLHGDLILPF